MKPTFFLSDFHLGIDARLSSRERERQVVRFLDWAGPQAAAIYLVGDVFEFWFEYKTVVPKGHSRLLGKLAELADSGLELHYFTGNHDLWMGRYFEEELGIPTHRQPILKEIGGKTFFIGHGDGLGPGDLGYKRMKKVFTNPACQWLFRQAHPDLGIGLANFWSGRSRAANQSEDLEFLGENGEWLIQYANRKLDTVFADYYIFGHRHLPIDWLLKNGKSRYLNLGEWLRWNTFAAFDGTDISLQIFENEQVSIYKNW